MVTQKAYLFKCSGCHRPIKHPVYVNGIVYGKGCGAKAARNSAISAGEKAIAELFPPQKEVAA